MENKRKILMALGGNAIEPETGEASAQRQMETVAKVAVHIAGLVKAGAQVVVTHGNGPQIGRVIIQNQLAIGETPAMPVDICGAMTQGWIGYMLQNQLGFQLKKLGIDIPVVSLVTQVEVDPNDPAFSDPTKPIGPFYSEGQAKEHRENTGYIYKEDAGRGWRRVIASPKPKKVIEAESASLILNAGGLVIVAGGGGIPVVAGSDGSYNGVEAVIDKDLSSALLADQMDMDSLFILTAVDKIMLNFGKENQQPLDKITVAQAEEYISQGHFAPGSMLPKVRAAINFVSGGENRQAIITSPDNAGDALKGKAGTVIIL